MSLIKDIIKGIQNEFENKTKAKNWIDNSNYWIENDIGTDEFAEKIIKIFKNTKLNITKKKIEKRPRSHVSVIKKNNETKIFREEEGLERLIQIMNKDDFGNQIIPKLQNPGKQLIDLAKFDKGNIESVIELKIKKAKSTSTPLFAVIELIKNYYLCGGKNSGIKKLILLAPDNYYEYFFNNNKKEKFKHLIDFLSEKLSVQIKVKKLDFKAAFKENYEFWLNEINKQIPSEDYSEKIKWNDAEPNKKGKVTDKYQKIMKNFPVEFFIKKFDKKFFEVLIENNWKDVL